MQPIDATTKQVKFKDIDRSDRARIEYPDIDQLAHSLYVQGFIHPITINQNAVLIAGGRRSAAIDHLLENSDEYPYAEAHPDMRGLLKHGVLHNGIHFNLKPTTSEDHLRELELIENVQRHNFTWQEEVIAIAKIHKLKRKEAILDENYSWGTAETGRLLKISKASVSYATTVASHLEDPDSPLWSADGLTSALQLIASQKFDEGTKMLVEKAQSRAKTLPNIATHKPDTPPADDFFSTFSPDTDEGGHMNAMAEPSLDGDSFACAQMEKESHSTVEHDQSIALASSMVKHMNCVDFFEQLPAGSVDCIITDPPYGIDMANLSQTNTGQHDIDRIAETHGVEENMSDFESWLRGCYKIMKETGYCIWWCDITQFEYIKALAKEVGFKVQSWQLTWVKTSNCLNQRAEYNFTKNTEIAIVMRKGDARLLKAQGSSVWQGALTAEDKDKFAKHPFIKPDQLWGWLLDAVALPGSVVCDPFSGVGSSTLAAFRRGYQVLNCEIDEVHYSQQINNLAGLINEMKG